MAASSVSAGEGVAPGGEDAPDRPPVAGDGYPLDEVAPLRPVDQPGDARLLELEYAGELEHADLPVAQHAEQPQLGDREVVPGGDAPEQRLDYERELDEPVHQAEVAVGPGRAAGRRAV